MRVANGVIAASQQRFDIRVTKERKEVHSHLYLRFYKISSKGICAPCTHHTGIWAPSCANGSANGFTAPQNAVPWGLLECTPRRGCNALRFSWSVLGYSVFCWCSIFTAS